MLNLLKNLFSGNPLRQFQDKVLEINALEPEIKALSDDELRGRSLDLRKKIQSKELSLDDAAALAFALVREASVRTSGKRPYDVQMLGGLVLHKGAIAEMSTGEGKTLAAVAPTYLNALTGEGVHVVTVNEYLARRDAVWMGQIYRFLGLTVSCLVPNAAYAYDPEWKIPKDALQFVDAARDESGSFMVQQDFLRPISRREAYLADVTYGTNHEFGFDYLRDNLSYQIERQVQRPHAFAIVDEVDSILIDEARTPLIISAPDSESSEYYKTFARIASRLNAGEDYEVDEKRRSVVATEAGIEKVQKLLNIPNLYAPENIRLVHYFEEALRAHAIYKRDKDYVVRNGEVLIVDEFTGRILQGRRYNGGLHQAIEAKEGVHVKEESRTYAKISVQNYFRMYKKISGMTGTAQTSAEEFHKVYGLEVFTIPTNRPCIRIDREDLVYRTFEVKMRAIVADVAERHKKGQPVLIGTTSIAKNEMVSAYLTQAGIPHEVLNAKNNEREGAIIAQAGRVGAVTVATNMAGRGVDIILGGVPFVQAEAEKVKSLGGLYVIGTERHEARRIDNQLRGRSGRQGDPGESCFYLSLEDDLIRIFGGGVDRIRALMDRLPEDAKDMPLKAKMVSRAIAEAQNKVEGNNFDIRKHLLEYDDVLNRQRDAIYRKRQAILTATDPAAVAQLVGEAAAEFIGALHQAALSAPEEEGKTPDEIVAEALKVAGIDISIDKIQQIDFQNLQMVAELLAESALRAAQDPFTPSRMLGMLDQLWMSHLEDLESLSDSVGLRGYAQRDPLVEYRREAGQMYKNLWRMFNEWVTMNIFRMAVPAQNAAISGQPSIASNSAPAISLVSSGSTSNLDPKYEGVGRNDPCPCGSGKKFKKCHGR